jgi:hypothetical protein
LCALVWPAGAGLVDFSAGLLSYVENKWGRDALPRLTVWQRLVRDNKAVAANGLPLVNGFFNQIPYLSDQRHWRAEDY